MPEAEAFGIQTLELRSVWCYNARDFALAPSTASPTKISDPSRNTTAQTLRFGVAEETE